MLVIMVVLLIIARQVHLRGESADVQRIGFAYRLFFLSMLISGLTNDWNVDGGLMATFWLMAGFCAGLRVVARARRTMPELAARPVGSLPAVVPSEAAP
jgi:hypothetical protein